MRYLLAFLFVVGCGEATEEHAMTEEFVGWADLYTADSSGGAAPHPDQLHLWHNVIVDTKTGQALRVALTNERSTKDRIILTGRIVDGEYVFAEDLRLSEGPLEITGNVRHDMETVTPPPASDERE